MPERIKLIPSEKQLHSQCVAWLRASNLPVLAHHSPNEGRRGYIAQADVKAMGVMAGWPDLELIRKDGQTLFIELKRPGGRMSDDQRAVHAALAEYGHVVQVVDRFNDFVDLVKPWVREVSP